MEQNTKETVSTRQQAAQWFANKSFLEQYELSDKYFESRNPSLLTIEQVEEMWLKEMQNQSEERTIEQHSDKQFKEFESESPISLTFSKLEKMLVEFACSVYDKNYNTDMSFRKRSETMVSNYLNSKL